MGLLLFSFFNICVTRNYISLSITIVTIKTCPSLRAARYLLFQSYRSCRLLLIITSCAARFYRQVTGMHVSHIIVVCCIVLRAQSLRERITVERDCVRQRAGTILIIIHQTSIVNQSFWHSSSQHAYLCSAIC